MTELGRRPVRRGLGRARANGAEIETAYRTRLLGMLSRQRVQRQEGLSHLDGTGTATVRMPGEEGLLLVARLFGPLSVAVDGALVTGWSSARHRSVFAYLLTHRQPWPPRDVLMDVFWPQSSPLAARNSLNVAIHGIRRTLKTATSARVIVYADGGYRLHPDVRLWLDVEEFDRQVTEGRRLEIKGETRAATEKYELAVALYRGDFFADSRYEEWPSLVRERMRHSYLDVLGRLANLNFDTGRYAASADLCERIVERDPCREDAHRRLMRCYSRQGQPHLALMQYEACARALATELGMPPDPSTTALRDSIRRHEPV